MRVALLTLAVVIGLPVAASAEPSPRGEERRSASKCPTAHEGLRFYSRRIEMWRDRLGVASSNLTRSRGCPRYLAKVRRKKARALRRAYKRHVRALLRERRQLYEKWRCIHEHEGAWNSNTGNGYYGGLQMDMGFQAAYGPEFLRRWGTADRWPVWAQLTAAERAYRTRGFGPWPNTARYCGLL